MNTHDVLTRAAGHLVASTNVFMDSGVENLMLRNMQRAYETTGNERLRWFFDEIGLPIGPVEEKALKSRNQAVHPTKSHTSEEVRQFVRMANVYRMLLVRAVLKVLSWKGAYMATAR
jgi:dihydroorotase-like cyclic amidohydrolase